MGHCRCKNLPKKDQVVQHINHLVSQNGFLTPDQIRDHITTTLHTSLSTSCVRFWMKRSGITRKKAVRVFQRPGLDEERKLFAEQHLTVWPTGRAISIDETAFYFDMKPAFGYSHKSRRLCVNKHVGEKCRWSCVMAVCDERVLGWKLIKGSIKSHDFANFVAGLDLAGRDILILDNAAIHKTSAVARVIDERNLTAVFLPPYSPQFQPIEHCFSVLKHAYRMACVNDTRHSATPPCADVVAERIQTAVTRLTSDCLQNTFRACWSRTC